MKNKITVLGVSGLLVLGGAFAGHAQDVVQNLSVSLVAYNQASDTTVQPVRVTTKDVIRLLTGSNVPSGQLLLVTSAGGSGPTSAPQETASLASGLRVMSRGADVADVPSPDSFNLFQDFVSVSVRGGSTTAYGNDHFSIDFGGFHVELQGATVWKVGGTMAGGGVTGPFVSTVNGRGTLDGVTSPDVPMNGTISAGSPKVSQ